MIALNMNKKILISFSLLFVLLSYSSKGQIVLNEVKVRPELAAGTPPNGLIYTGSKEYIEIYNAGCSPVNVAGYYIAMRTQPFSTLVQGGTLRIPNVPAANIPAKSHIVIAPAEAAPAADIDIVINSTNVPYCVYGGSGKFSIVNVDGWIALYDASGTPIDGMYWSSSAGNITTLPDFTGVLCLPPGSPISTLSNVVDIYNANPSLMKYAGGNFVTDSILVRQVDGTGDWVRNMPSSITKSSPSKNCNGGTCASATVPTFNPIGPLCQGSTPPSLPTQSTNGIDGTWIPSTISTSTVGTVTYKFSPSSTGCTAITASIDITVTAGITPSFNPVGPLCLNSTAPSLPLQSTNGINGSWSPSTIATNTAGTTTYTFTPTGTGCNSNTTLDITVSANVTPTFNPIGPLCLNSTAPSLPSQSNNGIDGTWSPSSIATNAEGTITYTFTPNTTIGCSASSASLDVTVTSNVTPTFDSYGPFCKDAILIQPILPETSNNGIIGKWSPASLSTAVAGNIEYTFTPASTGQCANPFKLTVLVQDNNASATLESDPGTDNQTVAVNSPITPIKYGFFPASGTPGASISVTGLPNGVTYSFPVPGASSLSISGAPTTSVGSPFTYTLTVKGNCEPVSVTGTITVADPQCVNVYNSFSPNGDGINDFWKVYDNFSCLKKVKVAVYNRYGSKVYESNDYKNTWDGRYRGGYVPDGTYYAVIVLSLNSGKTIEKRTDVTIVR
ncbi:MAG: T9SS type B sorting domain-containing protein [Ferruginibacter sp.]|nr:T9SS type B sorting domain-containing protein [Ferruginibacter sp.]